MTTLTTLRAEPSRDRWGRPLITPPDGGKPVPYTRVTTLAKTLDDTSALAAWKQRMTLIGCTKAPHLLVAAAAATDNRDKLNELAEQALTAAQAGAKAEIGTALHKFCERLDLGEDIGDVPEAYRADIEAYRAATAHITWTHVEVFIVLDDLQVAGTADRIGRLPDGRIVIADIKTGSIDYGGLSISTQLACYANGALYDAGTGQRTPLEVDDRTGVIIHLPAGQATCTLHDADLHRGWDAALQSVRVRDYRKQSKNWITPHQGFQLIPAPTPAAPAPDLAAAIEATTSVDVLSALWSAHGHAFTPELVQLAGARHALLTSGLVGAH